MKGMIKLILEKNHYRINWYSPLVNELETFFKENALASPNESAVRKIRFLCSRISATDYYVGEKCGEIEGLVGDFFSARKHKRYPGGADEIYERIVHDLLHRIRQRLKNIYEGI